MDYSVKMGNSFGLTHLYEFRSREEWLRVATVCNEADIFCQDKTSLRVFLSPNNTLDQWPSLLEMLGIDATEIDQYEGVIVAKKRSDAKCSEKTIVTSKLPGEEPAETSVTTHPSEQSPLNTQTLSKTTGQMTAKSKQYDSRPPRCSQGESKKRKADMDLPLNTPKFEKTSQISGSEQNESCMSSASASCNWAAAESVDSEGLSFDSLDSAEDLDAEIHFALEEYASMKTHKKAASMLNHADGQTEDEEETKA